MAIKTYKKTDSTKLSENFIVKEFSCHGSGCCSTVKIDTDLVNFLQKIRTHFKKPITINSGYRCSKHNKAVGGASQSKHTMGMAADIVVEDVKPKDVAKYAESIGVKGIGLYETDKDGYFVHIDTRTSKSFWYGQGQAYRDTFGGSAKTTTVKVNKTVLAWQKAAIADGFKLSADGIWGIESEKVAKKAICKKPLIKGLYTNKNLTKFLQKQLDIEVDGKFWNDTKKAVIKYQQLLKLDDDGIVGYNTWKKILKV